MSIPFSSDYTVRTYTVGYDSDGRVTETGPTTQTIQSIVTPLDERALERLPEGMRVGARYRVRTETDLGDLGDRAETSSLRILVDGREYQLDQWGRWDQASFGNLNHHKYLAREIRS